jgi:hypothetical protein
MGPKQGRIVSPKSEQREEPDGGHHDREDGSPRSGTVEGDDLSC